MVVAAFFGCLLLIANRKIATSRYACGGGGVEGRGDAGKFLSRLIVRAGRRTPAERSAYVRNTSDTFLLIHKKDLTTT